MTREEILERFRQGQSLEETLQQLADWWITNHNVDPAKAASFAQQDIDEVGQAAEITEAPLPFEGPVPRPIVQPEDIPTSIAPGFDRLRLEDEISGPTETPFGATRSLQNIAFGDILGDRFPNVGNRVTSALGRQFDVIQPSFEALQGLGQLGGANFRDFANENLGRGGIDPRLVAAEVGNLFGREGLSDTQSDFRDTLRANQNTQLELATQSALQGVPTRFAPATRRRVRRQFDQFLSDSPINPETGLPDFGQRNFLPAFNRGLR
ncbi:hypothetical protein LCGC14_0378970 [marine sediment metagenome]|uniref:Uncharacterized protein n=1 Tax=marine sediment metagenome TaxID=412755 RepID=A0A0F9TL56_9ZZZZ